MTAVFDRVVIVTGAASGIGAAIARALAGTDTALMLHTRKNAAGIEAVADECRALGSSVELFLGDLGSAETPGALVEATRSAFGRVDQIVSNAGQAARSRFGELSPADLQSAFDSMPIAFLRMVTAALPDIEASSWGRIVAVSSFVAHIFGTAGLNFPATSAAKAALEALVKSLAMQLGPVGATANAVVPGFTRKQGGGHLAATSDSLKTAASVTPTGRLTEPTDVAAAVAFLLSRDAGQITGQAVHVNGGLTLP